MNVQFSGYTAPQSTRPRFGGDSTDDAAKRAEETSAAAPGTDVPADSGKPSLLEEARTKVQDFISKQEIVHGSRDFIRGLINGYALNNSLRQASPRSTMQERVLAVFNLAAAQFNAAFGAADNVSSDATRDLLRNVLETFPKAVLLPAFDLALAPALGAEQLEGLRARFNPSSSEPDAVKAAVLEMLDAPKDTPEDPLDAPSAE